MPRAQSRAASDNNYRYRACVVEALGTRIVIEDSPDDAPHQVSQELAFVSRCMPGPPNAGHGLLSFDLVAKPDGADMELEATHPSLHTGTATVDAVLMMFNFVQPAPPSPMGTASNSAQEPN